MASSSREPFFEVQDLNCSLAKGTEIFHGVSFKVCEGDVIILQGKSGSGKTTLLKCLAHLNVYGGEILYRGKPPKHYGVPSYRTHILYVPQRPSLLPGTPRDFLQQVSKFGACQARVKKRHSAFTTPGASIETIVGRVTGIANEWGVEEALWDRPWATLSGGESQRLALAVAVGLDCAEILLLDGRGLMAYPVSSDKLKLSSEPTSALDAESSALVEKYLTGLSKAEDATTKALVWITHSAEQGQRVGTRFLSVAEGTCQEEPIAGNTV